MSLVDDEVVNHQFIIYRPPEYFAKKSVVYRGPEMQPGAHYNSKEYSEWVDTFMKNEETNNLLTQDEWLAVGLIDPVAREIIVPIYIKPKRLLTPETKDSYFWALKKFFSPPANSKNYSELKALIPPTSFMGGGAPSRSRSKPKPKPKVHTGPRGGKYVIINGRKVYQ